MKYKLLILSETRGYYIMKKTLAASAIITAIISIINLLTGYFGAAPIFSIHSTGGEYECWIGFGVFKEIFWPLISEDSMDKGHTEMHFSPISLIICFVIVLTVTFLVRLICQKIRRTK